MASSLVQAPTRSTAMDERMRLSFLVNEEASGDAGARGRSNEGGANVRPLGAQPHSRHDHALRTGSGSYSDCGVTSNEEGQMLYHLHEHRIDPYITICARCKLGFRTRDKYVDHLREVHPEEIDTKAEVERGREMSADRSGSTGGAARAPESRRSWEDGVRARTCPECHKVCKFKAELLYHLHLHKIDTNIVVCERCKLGFQKRYTYVDHMRGVHEKEKRHQCDLCDRGFYFRKDLTKHRLAVHQGLKPFQCELCEDVGFSKSEQLARHKKKYHGDEAGSSR